MSKSHAARMRIEHKSDTSGFFVGNGFSVQFLSDFVEIVFNEETLVANRVCDGAVTLLERGAKYKTDIREIADAEVTVLYHKDKLMVSEATHPNGASCITIIIDKLQPLNNLYVNTESR